MDTRAEWGASECPLCGHDDPHNWGDGYCIEAVGPCQCDGCKGRDTGYSELCMCSRGVDV